MKILNTMAYSAIAAVAAYNAYLAADVQQVNSDLTFENIAIAATPTESGSCGSGSNNANAGFGANCYGKDSSWDNGSYDAGRDFYFNGYGFYTADSIPMYSNADTINVVVADTTQTVPSYMKSSKASYILVNSKTTSHNRGRQGSKQKYLIQTVNTYNCIGPGNECDPVNEFEKYEVFQEIWYI